MMKYFDIPKFTNRGSYTVDIPWGYVEDNLEDWGSSGLYKLDLNPDFQRAHVWTREKQIAYVEYILRGGHAAREIYWNCTGWMRGYEGPMVLVDGKQRLEAVRAFMRGDIPAFGAPHSEFDKIPFDACSMRWYVNDLKTRAEILQWYIDLNTGGVVHTEEEIEKVRRLLAAEKGAR